MCVTSTVTDSRPHAKHAILNPFYLPLGAFQALPQAAHQEQHPTCTRPWARGRPLPSRAGSRAQIQREPQGQSHICSSSSRVVVVVVVVL